MAGHDFQPFHVMAENFSHYVNWPSETVISWNDLSIQPLREMDDFTHWL